MLPISLQIVVLVQVASKRVSAYPQLPEQPSPAPVSPDSHEAPLLVFQEANIGWPRGDGGTAARALANARGGKGCGEGCGEGGVEGGSGVGGKSDDGSKNRGDGGGDGGGKGGPQSKPLRAERASKGDQLGNAAAACGPAAVVQVVRDLSLYVFPSSLVALVGPVSAGKTSLLAAVWGEASVSRGSLTLTGQVAVMPQRPFTIGGTVLDNILMGRPYDKQRLQAVMEGCALMEDLDALPMREMTEVCLLERGTALIEPAWYFQAETLRTWPLLAGLHTLQVFYC
jgi:ABC-type multidrug transport system fused ATPase/permease subunit